MRARLRENRADVALTVATLVAIAVPYLLSPLRARLLGTTGRGDFAFFQAALTIAGAFAASGLRLAFYNSGIDARERHRIALGRPITGAALLSTVVLGGGAAIALLSLHSWIVAGALVCCMLLAPGYALIQVELAAAQRASDRVFVFVSPASTAFTEFFGNLLLVATRTFTLWTAIVTSLVAETARVVVALVKWRSARPAVRTPHDPELSREFATASRRYTALTIVPVLCTNIDVFIWGAFLPTALLGLYAISKMGYGFFLVLGATTEGRALRTYAQGGARGYAKGVLLPAVGVFVLASVAGLLLVPVIFGDAFQAAAYAFPIASFGGLLAFLFVSLSAVAAASGHSSVAKRAPAVLLGAVVVVSLLVGLLHASNVLVLTTALATAQLIGVLAVCGLMLADRRTPTATADEAPLATTEPAAEPLPDQALEGSVPR